MSLLIFLGAILVYIILGMIWIKIWVNLGYREKERHEYTMGAEMWDDPAIRAIGVIVWPIGMPVSGIIRLGKWLGESFFKNFFTPSGLKERERKSKKWRNLDGEGKPWPPMNS